MGSKTEEETKGKDTEQAFGVPALRTFEVVNLERLDPVKANEEAKKLKEVTLPELRKDVSVAVSWLEKKESELAEFLAKTDALAQELIQDKLEEQRKVIAEKRQWLQEYLGHQFGPYRRESWLAFLLYHFSRPFKGKDEVKKWFNEKLCADQEFLQGEGYLQITTEKGPAILTVLEKNYTVNRFANLNEDGIKQLRKALGELENKISHEEWLAEQNKTTSLLDQGTLSTEDLFHSKAGLFAARSWVNGDSQPKGTILVRSTGQIISVVEVHGNFQKEMEEIKKRNMTLSLRTLTWRTIDPNYFRGNPRETELMTLFWKAVKNSIAWKEKKERVQGWRDKLQKMVTENGAVAMDKFLADKTQTGSCFIEHEGRWDWLTPDKSQRETPISNLFFVAERLLMGENQEMPVIRIVDRPPWLTEFFAECPIGKSFPEGDKFAGLPQNLRMVLRKCAGQVEKRSQIAKYA